MNRSRKLPFLLPSHHCNVLGAFCDFFLLLELTSCEHWACSGMYPSLSVLSTWICVSFLSSSSCLKSVPFLKNMPSSHVLLPAINTLPQSCVFAALCWLCTHRVMTPLYLVTNWPPDGIFPLLAVVSQLPVRHSVNKKGLPVGSQTNSRLPQRLWRKDKGNIPSVSLSRSWLGKVGLGLEPVPQSQGFWLLGTWLFPVGCGC